MTSDSKPQQHATLRGAGMFLFGALFLVGAICIYVGGQALDAIGYLFLFGGCSLFVVDVCDYLTAKAASESTPLYNSYLSMVGSLLFAVAGIGYIPQIYANSPEYPLWTFVAGGIVVGFAELWKIQRLFASGQSKSVLSLYVAVPSSISLGAWLIFIAEVLGYANPQPDVSNALWMTATCLFFVAALVYDYRVFVVEKKAGETGNASQSV